MARGASMFGDHNCITWLKPLAIVPKISKDQVEYKGKSNMVMETGAIIEDFPI